MNTTLCALFQETAAARPDKVALRTLDGSSTLTWAEYGARVRRVAAGLAALGVGRGDTVGLMLVNRPEFHVVDAAALHVGATPFSGYNTNTVDMIRHLLDNAGNRVVVCEEQFLNRILEAIPSSKVEHVICVDGAPEGTMSLSALEELGASDEDFDFDATWRAVEPDDVATLIYTSGTTGPPKGVELTHANLRYSLDAARQLMPQSEDTRLISYLPDAHALNRYLAHYFPMASGAEVTTVANSKELLEALTTVRPTIFVSVPMLWYKLKASIDTGLASQSGPRKVLAEWALARGQRAARAQLAHRRLSPLHALQYAVARRLVLDKVAAKLGLDRCTFAVTGAAPIAPEAMEFVLSLGIPLCEAWGMSELTAVATLNRHDNIRLGTVGQVLDGQEIKVADDGELLVRGPNVMKGYRGEPARTAEAVIDGWMHTGDVGTIDEDGFVRIIDRKKELIINSAGKNMSPSHIENTVKMACPLLGSVVAIGDDRPFVAALLTLDAEAVEAFTTSQGLTVDGIAEMAEHPAVLEAVAAGIAAANDKLARVEQVREYVVLPVVWEPAGDELTPTMKLRRKPIHKKYADAIDTMYAEATR
ncbi:MULTISPECIES: AMP-dependent synthetase/ligase [unclassified Nocardioides]|uniref:AMP-dependent synthetase/ligase n=1 Tax=unclassified Nocardioides TaxID=2615069 RepID=UPI0006F924E8|nr:MULTISPECIES: long-chain fatty acid--CoA ligase [unclassified Nocardioides]KRA28010.1 AMP-dependent synthetase [Nocardioides sp. Root614]KRA85985.1 AMP-dependent synthetase [Nocardioides sp. Root682]